MDRSIAEVGTRIALGLLLLVPSLLLTPPSPAQAVTRGPCGESESLPGPGHYSGGFKGTLVRTISLGGFASQELTVPIGGTLEIDIDEAGRVTGQAAPPLPTDSGGSPGGISAALDGQLPEPLVGADVPARGQVQLNLSTGPLGAPLTLSSDTVLHFRDFQRELCAAVQGSWTLENVGSDDAGRLDLRDAQWAAKLVGFNEDVEREIRGGAGLLANLPPAQALGMPEGLSRQQADALIDGLVAGTATPPNGGLFELYQKAQAAQAPAAQVRCLVDFVQTVIALKLQEYLAAGATPTYEEAARYGYALKVAEAVGAGPSCAAYTGGRTGLHDLIGAVLQAMIGDGSDVDGVTRLTREANAFGFDDLYQAGKSWLAQRGVAV